MSFKDTLDNLREKKNTIYSELKYLKKSEQEEINNTTQLIHEKYKEEKEPLIKDFLSSFNEIKEECKKIEEYSCFYSKDIVSAIDDLIRIYEGERYTFQNTYYHVDPKRSILTSEVAIFIKKDKAIEGLKGYPFHYFKSLLKHGEVLVLINDDNLFTNKDINFYKYDGKRDINQTIKYGKFNYIKDFIDYIISYRIENDIDEISFETLNELKVNFIKSRIDEIYEYHDKITKCEEEHYKNKLESNKNRRDIQLKRIIRK